MSLKNELHRFLSTVGGFWTQNTTADTSRLSFLGQFASDTIGTYPRPTIFGGLGDLPHPSDWELTF